MALVPLYDLTQQFQNKNGSILVAGKLFVYYIGRPDLATTWADDGASAVNPNPILLDNNGRAPCFVDDGYSYTLVVCDRNGQELFSQDITPGGAGGVGGRVVYHDETMSGAGTVASLLGVVNMPLGVDDTMTAYTGVVDNKDALILGVNGDWFNSMYSGMKGGYVTKEEFSACCSAVKGGLDNKVDLSALDNYYTKYEVNSALSNKVDVNYFIDYTSAMEDRLEHSLVFGYDENSAISSINYSALAGGQGGYSPWISAAKVIGETSSLVPGQWFQVLSSIDVSGIQNHCIGVKGAAYTFPTTAQFYDWLSLWQYLPSAHFNNFISGSYQPNMNSLFSSAGWLMYNKLDISAFSAWSAEYSHDDAETYTVTGGHYIDISADDDLKQTTISVTGVDEALQLTSGTLHNEIASVSSDLSSFSAATVYDLGNKKVKQSPITLSGENQVITALYQNSNGEISAAYGESVTGGDYTPWISGAKILADTQTMTDNMLIQVLSSFTLSGNKNHCIAVKGGTYRFPNKWEIASGINETSSFLTNSAFNTYQDLFNGYVSNLYSQDGYLSGRIATLSGESNAKFNYVSGQIDNKLNKSFSSNFYPMTGNPSGFLTTETDWTNTIKAASSNAYNQATGNDPDMSKYIPYSSLDVRTVDGNSAVAGIDTYKLFASYAYKDENGDRLDTSYVKISALNNWIANTASTFSGLALSSVYCVNGGNPFPMTNLIGGTGYTANVSYSGVNFTTANSNVGAGLTFDVNKISHAAYRVPSIETTWRNIINKANEDVNYHVTCSAIALTTGNSRHDFNCSAYPNLKQITFMAPNYGPYGRYSAVLSDEYRVYHIEIDSGCACTVYRAYDGDQDRYIWFEGYTDSYNYLG